MSDGVFVQFVCQFFSLMVIQSKGKGKGYTAISASEGS